MLAKESANKMFIAGLLLVLLGLAGCGSITPKNSGASASEPTAEPAGKGKDPDSLQSDPVVPQGEIRGTVRYRERIALLPGAFVRVVLIRQGKRDEPPLELSEQIFHPSGQVPFRYRLSFDPAEIRGGFRYELKGQIFSDDERLLFTSDKPVPVEPLGRDRIKDLMLQRVPVTHQSHLQPVTAAVSRVFQCGDFVFATRTGIGEIGLYLPDGFQVLSQVRAASGARYREGDTLFWMKGDQAMLAYQGQFYRQCRRNPEREARDPAERRPVDVRALGHEPPWLLEVVTGHHLNLITEYGQKRISLPAPEVRPSEGGMVYRARNKENRVAATFKKRRCQDTMSDKIWPASVSIWWNGHHYEGCGELLNDARW